MFKFLLLNIFKLILHSYLIFKILIKHRYELRNSSYPCKTLRDHILGKSGMEV